MPDRRKLAAPVLAQAASFVVVLLIGGFTGHSPAPARPAPTTPASAHVGATGHQSGVIVEIPLSAATGGVALSIPVKILGTAALTTTAEGTPSPNAQDTQLDLDEPLPAGTYQVCAQPSGGLRFTDRNTGVMPGWDCMVATVAADRQTPVIFHLAQGTR
jgi:hypothetical protein